MPSGPNSNITGALRGIAATSVLSGLAKSSPARPLTLLVRLTLISSTPLVLAIRRKPQAEVLGISRLAEIPRPRRFATRLVELANRCGAMPIHTVPKPRDWSESQRRKRCGFAIGSVARLLQNSRDADDRKFWISKGRKSSPGTSPRFLSSSPANATITEPRSHGQIRPRRAPARFEFSPVQGALLQSLLHG